MNDQRERLIRCFQAVFPELSPEEIVRASPTSVGAWDSVATVTLIGVVEEEFGVSVDPEEIENVISFELMLDYIANSAKVS